MNPQKVNSSHLQRNAYLYIRQSTLKQVTENTESSRRQYALRQQAVALGWPLEHIVVIDSDMGQSGASRSRDGFQRLVAEVSLGRAGIVLGLEVSRLARSSTDWHRLLEICALADTLILDEDGIYDPKDFNDRLLLGLKGTMSEAELHILKSRMRGGILNKARRGALKSPLPIGFNYDDKGRVLLDPDQQVQKSIKMLFQTFRRVGSAFSTVKAFNEQGLKFPQRLHKGFRKGELSFGPLVHSRVLQILHNPRYAGAFFYGKTQVQQKVTGEKASIKHPREKWHALIKDAHEGYISWDEFEENQRILLKNAQILGNERRKSPPREGSALLQGLVICGICGKRMTVRYHSGAAGTTPTYVCQRQGIEHAEKMCQIIPGATLDKAVSKLLLELITPLALEVTLAVQQELKARAAEAENLHMQQLERLRYETELARRRYIRVDPDNRLVAGQLEADWNTKLRELVDAQEQYEKRCQSLPVDAEQKKLEVFAIAADFPRIWQDKDLPDRERKRIIRLLVEDVTLLRKEQINTCLRFKGGASRSLTVPVPLQAFLTWKTDPDILQEIDRLLENNTCKEIATILNKRGVRSGKGQSFTKNIVWKISQSYGLKDRPTRLREKGMLTAEEMAGLLDVTPNTVKIWRRNGLLKAHKTNDKNEYLYEHPGDNPPQKGKWKKILPVEEEKTTASRDERGAL